MRPVGKPEEHWGDTAAVWLRSIGMLPQAMTTAKSAQEPLVPVPCPSHQVAVGRPNAPATTPSGPPENPNCL
jgi:hypothetical protein